MYLNGSSGSDAPEIDNKGRVSNENPGLQTNRSIRHAQTISIQTVTMEPMTELYIMLYTSPIKYVHFRKISFLTCMLRHVNKNCPVLCIIYVNITGSPASTISNQMHIDYAIKLTV